MAKAAVAQKEARGYVKNIIGNKFNATFSIDEVAFTFSGVINPPVTPFEAGIAILKYDNTTQLVAKQSYDGHIGATDVLFNLPEGVTIAGQLTAPLVMPGGRVRVAGDGTWGAN